MTDHQRGEVAILYPGDRETRRDASLAGHRLAPMAEALDRVGLRVEPIVYDDAFADQVRRQLQDVDAVLVWRNPIQEGSDRTVLDTVLREAADAGAFVSTHPDVILAMGTKEVLHRTRTMTWGCDTRLYRDAEQLGRELPDSLAAGGARVLKQHRGNGGSGVWKVEVYEGAGRPRPDTRLRVRHAERGSVEERITLGQLLDRCLTYLADGPVVDQAYQERLPEGMARCYLVHDQVVGFGHQAVNALFPAPEGAPQAEAPQPGPRLYHPPGVPEFQALKTKVEQDWVPEMQRLLDIRTTRLPVLWDCDFLLGPKTPRGEDTHVLCEINVCSVAPFPESAAPFVAEATLARVLEDRRRRS